MKKRKKGYRAKENIKYKMREKRTMKREKEKKEKRKT